MIINKLTAICSPSKKQALAIIKGLKNDGFSVTYGKPNSSQSKELMNLFGELGKVTIKGTNGNNSVDVILNAKKFVQIEENNSHIFSLFAPKKHTKEILWGNFNKKNNYTIEKYKKIQTRLDNNGNPVSKRTKMQNGKNSNIYYCEENLKTGETTYYKETFRNVLKQMAFKH